MNAPLFLDQTLQIYIISFPTHYLGNDPIGECFFNCRKKMFTKELIKSRYEIPGFFYWILLQNVFLRRKIKNWLYSWIFQAQKGKDWPAKKVTIFNTMVHLVKTSDNILFFACILPDSVADEITKELWKNSPFEKMRADFLLRSQNLLR